MEAHRNARATPRRRQLIVDGLAQGWTASAVALAPGIDPKTLRKWRDRFTGTSDPSLGAPPKIPDHRAPSLWP